MYRIVIIVKLIYTYRFLGEMKGSKIGLENIQFGSDKNNKVTLIVSNQQLKLLSNTTTEYF